MPVEAGFDRDEALDALADHLGAALADLPAAEAVRRMMSFYDTVPAAGALGDDDDGDMLLFQWGVPRRRPEVFLVNITRQLIYALDDEGGRDEIGDDEDEGFEDDETETEIWQLRLDFELVADEELTALGRGNIWCHAHDDIDAFRDEVFATEAFRALETHTVTASDSEFGPV